MMQQDDAQIHPIKQLPARYDGLAKVTGTAKYVAEFKEPFPKDQLCYGYIVQSTIPAGTVTSMDHAAAEKSSGVIAVLTPFNAPKLPVPPPAQPARRALTVLQNNEVAFNGQPIALIVAKSLPEAREAARLLNVRYKETPARLQFHDRLSEARLPRQPGKEPPSNHRGDINAAFAQAAVTVDHTYVTPIQNHNPMELHATLSWWEGQKLNVYDTTQYISGSRQSIARIFQLPLDDVRVICPYVGGGFGSKGSAWSHVILSCMASRVTNRPVKVVLEREHMFSIVGARPTTINKIKIGATADGKITGIQHDVIMHGSILEDFTEHSASPTKMLYASPALSVSEKIVDQNLGVCTFMRAPGEAPGTAVLEIAIDELAEKLNMDPVQLRLLNYAEKNPSDDKPWTDKHLRDAYTQAAQRFGWSRRPSKPGTIREGNKLIGYGMATATYPANRSSAQATVRILPGGKAWVGCGSQDLGTGTYTHMAQVCADALTIDPSLVTVALGDSKLPKAPVSGGSQSTASVAPAVKEAAQQAKLKLIEAAIAQPGPLKGLKNTDLDLHNGSLVSKSTRRSATIAQIIERNGNQPIEAQGSAEPGETRDSMSAHSWGAVFAEVAVDADTHMVDVRRVVATYDIGTLLNEKPGLNQLQGGIVWGIGFALHEETHMDPIHGRAVNENIAEYHVPTNLDVGNIDVTVLNIPDTKFNPLGCRGIGEIGNTGSMAAVANAIYNATGKRVREYPITPDKLMSA